MAPSTASVVFSGKAGVADATREKVMTAASDLGYTGPDPRAASLRRGRSGIVAVVLEGHLRTVFSDPVTIRMMDGITDGLAEAGAGVLLLRDEDDEQGAPTIATAPVDAVVLIGCSGRARESLEAVRGRGLPVVVIEGDAGDDVPQIGLDSGIAAREIAEHVHALGHRDVAVVTLPLDSRRERGPITSERAAQAIIHVAMERLDGVREIYPDAPAFAAGGSSIDEGLIAGRALLADPEHRPTAILAQSDMLAAGLIRAAEERGLRVPQDLSITGFDGVDVDGLGPHILTTSVQPAGQKGRAAGEQITRMLRGEQPASQELHCQFRAGTTTAAPPR